MEPAVPLRSVGTNGGPSLYRAVAQVHRSLRRAVRERFPLTPLPRAQIELLRLVAERDRIPVGEAAEYLRLAPNTVSTLVGELDRAGLVRRVRDVDDARVVRLHATKRARARLAAWRDQGGQVLDAALARLTEEERRLVSRAVPLLERLADEVASLP